MEPHSQPIGTWWPLEPDLDTRSAAGGRPLEELAAGRIPAVMLRNVYPPAACQRLIERLVSEELLYDPGQPIPEKFIESAIPEGYYREGRSGQEQFAWQAAAATGKRRIDIGTSLGYRGSNREEFFAHSQETHALFDRLFPADDDPVQLCYDCLQTLSCGKRVVTAYEPDGRRYGPAIVRAHYGGYTYKPHFDSVRLREKRVDYAVYKFEHQFAGVLLLQNTQLGEATAQCVLHNCLWRPEIDSYLKDGAFHEYARQQQIQNVEICLNPGDLYFFNTRMIHEVPGVAGDMPRVVLAMFIGYSSERDEIFVWS